MQIFLKTPQFRGFGGEKSAGQGTRKGLKRKSRRICTGKSEELERKARSGRESGRMRPKGDDKNSAGLL
jgi:hypothetical protein